MRSWYNGSMRDHLDGVFLLKSITHDPHERNRIPARMRSTRRMTVKKALRNRHRKDILGWVDSRRLISDTSVTASSGTAPINLSKRGGTRHRLFRRLLTGPLGRDKIKPSTRRLPQTTAACNRVAWDSRLLSFLASTLIILA